MQERDYLNSKMVAKMVNTKGGGGNTGLGDGDDTTGGGSTGTDGGNGKQF